MREVINHTLEPIYDKDCTVLILGTMPSPKSRENGFYYGNPQNKFWRVMSDIFKEKLPVSNDEKKEFLLRHHIALWDVLKSCEINGADDNSIKDPVPNDLSLILNQSNIKTIFTTGKKAAQLYKKHCYPHTKIHAISLPSTSPANCRFYKYEDLVAAYQEIVQKSNS
ncbi:MAG: DNA-deoxyinosine glycosylase [Turicibacter sp.]